MEKIEFDIGMTSGLSNLIFESIFFLKNFLTFQYNDSQERCNPHNDFKTFFGNAVTHASHGQTPVKIFEIFYLLKV